MQQKADSGAFLRGSLLLTVSALTAKICGALFKIPLTALLGGVGMGYFSTAYGLFLPLYAVLVTGLSTAVAKPVAARMGRGDSAGALAIRNTARLVFLGTGLLGTASAILLAKYVTRLSAGNDAPYPAVLAIAPAVLLCSLTAVERGYWEGLCCMTPTAVSQAAEALAKVICGLLLCRKFLAEPPEMLAGCTKEAAGACGAVLGVTISSFAGWLCVMLWSIGEKHPGNKIQPPAWEILRELFAILIPAALGALVTNLTTLIDLVTVMRMLPGGDPAFLYGSFMGMAVTVFGLVPSLTNMLAKGVLPCTAQAWASGNQTAAAGYARQVLTLTGLAAIPAGCGILVLAKPALEFLFAGRDAEIAAAFRSLQALAPGMIALCLVFPVFSLLQAVGRADLPVKLMLPGLCVKLTGNLLLIPRLGIAGAALSTSLCYLTIFLPALFSLRKLLHEPLHLTKPFLSQIFAGAMCAAAAWSLYGRMRLYPQRVAFTCAVGAAGIVYVTAIFLLGGIRFPASSPMRRTD